MAQARRRTHPPVSPQAKKARSTVARVLVLEDRDAPRRAILAALGVDGLDAQTLPRDAPGPAVAALQPDAVIVGFDAEDGDGFDCLRRVARMVGVVIAVSGSAKPMLPALEAGAQDFVALPDGKYLLLAHLASRPGTTFTRPELLAAAWGDDYRGDGRVVDAHVWRLRRKLPAEGSGRIVTIRGFGYMFRPAL